MATGSYFILLRSINGNEQYEDNYKIEDFKMKYTEKNNFSKSKNFYINEFHVHPLKFDFDSDFDENKNYKWVSIRNGKIYDQIFKFNFISGYTTLREEFNLDSFQNNELVIDVNMANEIKIAVDYLLSRNFSLKFEDILNNNFISLFGKLLPSYENFKLNEEICEDSNIFENEGRYFLKKTRMLMEAFLYMEKENSLNELEYKLVYHVW